MKRRRLEFKSSAYKQFSHLDRGVQLRFQRAFDELSRRGPHAGPLLDVKSLEGRHGFWRLRVGGYRAIFEIRGDVIFVTRIGDRKNIYRT